MERKNPKDMIDIELLEAYSHFTKMYYKTKEEQGYTAGLRKEILKRMSRGQEQWKRYQGNGIITRLIMNGTKQA